jgi:hypothetical protein
MSTSFAFKPIVTDGLILNLDAANRKSFVSGSTVWNDLSGRGNNGTITSGVTYSSTNGGSLMFNGSTGYVNCGNSSTYNVNNFTVNFWTKFNLSELKEIFIKNNNTNNGLGPIELFQSNQKIGTRINAANLITGSIDLTIGLWYMVTYTYNSVNRIIYINGVIDITSPFTTPTTTSTGDLVIGAYGNGLYPFNGSISNIMFYNRALSATEILQNYNVLKNRYI